MNCLKTVALTLFLLFLSHCKNSQPTELQGVVVKETHRKANVNFVFEKRIPLPDLKYPSLFAANGVVYAYGFSMSDSKTALLKIHDKELNVLTKKLFQYGQGPGDLGAGFHFYKYGTQNYVPDNTQRRINIFDDEFKFKEFIKYKGGYITIIKNGEFAIRSTLITLPEKRKRVLKLFLFSVPDLKERVLKVFEPYTLLDERGRYIQYNANGFHYFCRLDTIYILNQKNYNISTYNLEGSPLKSIIVDVNKKILSDETRELWLRELRGNDYKRIKGKVVLTELLQPASFMVPLGKGFAVIRRESYNLNCKGKAMVTADYFDYQLNLKGQIQIPCFYRIFELTYLYTPRTFHYNQGCLYLVTVTENEEHYLEKWRVHE